MGFILPERGIEDDGCSRDCLVRHLSVWNGSRCHAGSTDYKATAAKSRWQENHPSPCLRFSIAMLRSQCVEVSAGNVVKFPRSRGRRHRKVFDGGRDGRSTLPCGDMPASTLLFSPFYRLRDWSGALNFIAHFRILKSYRSLKGFDLVPKLVNMMEVIASTDNA